MFKRLALLTVFFVMSLTVTAQALPTLTLDPVNGALSGAPGTIVGWGFTITNLSDYLVVSGANFNTVSPWVSGTTTTTFTDFIGPQFLVVGPAPESTTLSQLFDSLLLTGVGSTTIAPDAPSGTVAAGTIDIFYDLYRVSPYDSSFDSVNDLISTGNTLSADASVTVTASAVPEPGTLLLFCVGLGALVFRRRARTSAT